MTTAQPIKIIAVEDTSSELSREHLLKLRAACISLVVAIEDGLGMERVLGKTYKQRKHEAYLARVSPEELGRRFDKLTKE